MFLLIRYYSLTGYFVTDTETLKMEFYFLADLHEMALLGTFQCH